MKFRCKGTNTDRSHFLEATNTYDFFLIKLLSKKKEGTNVLTLTFGDFMINATNRYGNSVTKLKVPLKSIKTYSGINKVPLKISYSGTKIKCH